MEVGVTQGQSRGEEMCEEEKHDRIETRWKKEEEEEERLQGSVSVWQPQRQTTCEVIDRHLLSLSPLLTQPTTGWPELPGLHTWCETVTETIRTALI